MSKSKSDILFLSAFDQLQRAIEQFKEEIVADIITRIQNIPVKDKCGIMREALPPEDEDAQLFRTTYDLKSHVRIAILREKDLGSDDTIARFLNEEQGVNHWTGVRVREFFGRALSEGWTFTEGNVQAEYQDQIALEKNTILRRLPKKLDFNQSTAEDVDGRFTTPGEVWILQAQGLTDEQIARRLKVDLDDLRNFIQRNIKYIEALYWR